MRDTEVPYQEESNADLYWNATSRLEVLSKRLKATGEHSLAHLTDEAIGRLHTVANELEK